MVWIENKNLLLTFSIALVSPYYPKGTRVNSEWDRSSTLALLLFKKRISLPFYRDFLIIHIVN